MRTPLPPVHKSDCWEFQLLLHVDQLCCGDQWCPQTAFQAKNKTIRQCVNNILTQNCSKPRNKLIFDHLNESRLIPYGIRTSCSAPISCNVYYINLSPKRRQTMLWCHKAQWHSWLVRAFEIHSITVLFHSFFMGTKIQSLQDSGSLSR